MNQLEHIKADTIAPSTQLARKDGVYIFSQTMYELRAADQELHMPCESETFEGQRCLVKP